MIVLPAPGSSARRTQAGLPQHLEVDRLDLVGQGPDAG